MPKEYWRWIGIRIIEWILYRRRDWSEDLSAKGRWTFADVTSASGLDRDTLSSGYFGVWAADIEMDGDLDLVLGSALDARVTVLRNNGDGNIQSHRALRRSDWPARLRMGRSR